MAKFQPGQSGNPSGRPKMAEELSKGLREFCENVGLEKLKALADDPDPRVRLAAIQFAFDRTYGKSVAPIEAKVEGADHAEAHLEALKHLGQSKPHVAQQPEARPEPSEASDSPAEPIILPLDAKTH